MTRDLVRKARQEIEDYLFYRGHEPVDFVIKDVGYEPQEFIKGSGDSIEAVRIDNADVSLYIYTAPPIEKLKEGYLFFPPHFHANLEVVLVLSGELEITTKRKKEVLKAGETCFFRKGVHHKAKFAPETKLLLTYHPAFKDDNWQAKKSDGI